MQLRIHWVSNLHPRECKPLITKHRLVSILIPTLSPQVVYYSMWVLIMIYAKFIACSEVFCSKILTRTFSELVISSKKLFLANVAAMVATTPKNNE